MYKLIMTYGDDRGTVELEFPTEAAANSYMVRFTFHSDPCDVHMRVEHVMDRR